MIKLLMIIGLISVISCTYALLNLAVGAFIETKFGFFPCQNFHCPCGKVLSLQTDLLLVPHEIICIWHMRHCLPYIMSTMHSSYGKLNPYHLSWAIKDKFPPNRLDWHIAESAKKSYWKVI